MINVERLEKEVKDICMHSDPGDPDVTEFLCNCLVKILIMMQDLQEQIKTIQEYITNEEIKDNMKP